MEKQPYEKLKDIEIMSHPSSTISEDGFKYLKRRLAKFECDKSGRCLDPGIEAFWEAFGENKGKLKSKQRKGAKMTLEEDKLTEKEEP